MILFFLKYNIAKMNHKIYDIVRKSFYDFMLSKYTINSMVNVNHVFKIVKLWDNMKEYIITSTVFPIGGDDTEIDNFWSEKTRGVFDRIQNGELTPILINGLLTADNYKRYLEEKNQDPFDIQFEQIIPYDNETILYCNCEQCVDNYLYYDQMALENDY
jgi:hypothetical protein